MMIKTFLVCFFIFLRCSEGAKILGAVFSPSYSHQIVFQPIWRELSLRGHNVTVLTTNPMNDNSLTNLTEIDLGVSYEVMKEFKTDEIVVNKDGKGALERTRIYISALNASAYAQFSLPKVQDLINDESEHFDLLMIEVIFPVHMGFAHRFRDTPFIGLISLDALPRLHSAIGNPVHPVLYPDPNLPFHGELTFLQRLASTAFYVLSMYLEDNVLYPGQDKTVRTFFGEDAPPLSEIQKNMSLMFINANPVFQKVRPLGPATIEIGGGIHLQKPKPLPNNIKEFLDNAREGFVYFSLGTNVKSAVLQDHTKEAIFDALSRVPYKILWKFEEDYEGLPSNVKIVKWVPQISVLAHPNIKAFITQCGLQSIEEAIHYKVPLLGIPFYGDQHLNSKILVEKGIGVTLRVDDLEAVTLQHVIIDVATNPRFRENLAALKDLVEDQIVSGLDKAVWWSEYVIRHKGAKHLKSPFVDIPGYQYFMIDIIAFVCVVLGSLIFIIAKIVTFVLFSLLKLRRDSNKKMKKKKND